MKYALVDRKARVKQWLLDGLKKMEGWEQTTIDGPDVLKFFVGLCLPGEWRSYSCLFSRYVDGCVCVDGNPFCVNAHSCDVLEPRNRLYLVGFGSFDPSKRVLLASNEHDTTRPDRWARMSKKYNLEVETSWHYRPDGYTTVLLAKFGGWKYRDTDKSYRKCAKLVRNVVQKSEFPVIVRMHPSSKREAVEKFKKQCAAFGIRGVRYDHSPSISNALVSQTRLAVSEWGTAAMAFVMSGVPVLNVNETPTQYLCHAVSLSDPCVLKSWEGEYDKPNVTPFQFCESMCRSVFSASEFEDGSVLRLIRQHAESERQKSLTTIF